MRTYETSEGERLDDIVFAQYGETFGFLEAVLAANPKLSDYGIILPAGVKITFPKIQPRQAKPSVTLWD